MTSHPGNRSGASGAILRLRFAPSDARYGNGLIAGAKVVEIFGDLETEIAIHEGGDEGLCVAYDFIEFLQPLFVGDFVEARASVSTRGTRSRKIELEIFRTIAGSRSGAAEPLDPPVLAARAMATIVVGTKDRVAAAGADEGSGL